MYKNLITEIKKCDISINDMSENLKIPHELLIARFSGKTEWTRKEMLDIKYKFFPNLSLEYLFENSNACDEDSKMRA